MDIPDPFIEKWMSSHLHGTRTAGLTENIKLSPNRRRAQDTFSMVLVERGSIDVQHGDMLLSLAPGDMGLLQPGESTRFRCVSPNPHTFRFAEIHFSPARTGGQSPLHDIDLPHCVPHPHFQRMKEVIHNIGVGTNQRHRFKTNKDRLLADGWVHELITTFLVEGFEKGLLASTTDSPAPWIEETLTYLQNSIRKNITAMHLERLTGYSQVHMNREFRKVHGKTPLQYLRDRRLDIAASILKSHPKLSIRVLCQRAGFKSHKTFEQAFKRRFGVSPRSAP